jgi:hypothetical protein
MLRSGACSWAGAGNRQLPPRPFRVSAQENVECHGYWEGETTLGVTTAQLGTTPVLDAR